jgi:PST family polysaccharide transporter
MPRTQAVAEAPRRDLEDRDPERYFETAHLKPDLARRTVLGGALILGSQGVRLLIEAARIIILARLLSPADYGLVAMVTVVTGFIGIFLDLGLNMLTVTREKITHAQVSTLFWINVGVGAGLAVVTAAMAPLFSWFYDEPRLVAITLALAPTFLLLGLTVQHQGLLRRQMRFGTVSAIAILSATGGLTVAILMVYWGAGYWALVGMTIATVATNLVAVWIACEWRPARPVRGVGAREMIRFGTHVTGTNVVNYLSRRLDHVLVGWWWGAAPLGLYTKADSLVETPTNRVLLPIGAVTVPSLSRLADEPERYRDAYLRTLEKLALGLMPGSVFLIGCANWLIPFALGPRWADAAPIFGTLAALAFVRPIDGSDWWLFVSQNRAREGFRCSLVRVVITGIAAAIGLPWGTLGVATAVAISGFVRTPLVIWYVTRRGPVRASDIYCTIATPALASACALAALVAVAPWATDLSPPVVLAVGLVITAVVSLIVLCALTPGRRALRDVWLSLRLLRRQRQATGNQ